MKFEDLINRINNLRNHKLKVLHFDYDEPFNVWTFRGLRKAIRLFGKDNIDIIKTSSGHGIQVRVKVPNEITPIEALFLYHLFYSDPWRTNFIVNRIVSSNNPIVDVSFIKKKYPDGYINSIQYLNELKDILLIEDEEESYNKYVEYLNKVLSETTFVSAKLTEEQLEKFFKTFKIRKLISVKDPDGYIIIKLKVHSENMLKKLQDWFSSNNITYKIYKQK
jgi:hypothetical protein